MAEGSTAVRDWLRGEGPNPLTCEFSFHMEGEDKAASEHSTINSGDLVNLAMIFAAVNMEAFRTFCVNLAMSEPAEPELAAHYRTLQPTMLHIVADAVMNATERAEQAHDVSACGEDHVRHEH